MNYFLKKILPIFLIVAIAACGGESDDTTTPTLPRLAINDVTLFEGNDATTFNFKVNLSEVSTETVTVDYVADDISAVEGEDFEPASGTLSFSPGETLIELPITIIGDTLNEGDENFRVVLTNAVNATIQNSIGTGTIRNDDTFFDPGSDDGYTTPESYAGMSLVWRDEFNGTSLNTDDWNYETGTGNSGWGNNELQYYTSREDNVWVNDGKLVIEAKQEAFGGRNYTSARLTTQNKQDFQFGRIDIRAKLPLGQGLWPALWMLGSDFGTTGWPACGEIDIMELLGHQPNRTHGTAHWGNIGSPSISASYHKDISGTFADEFHVFSIIWEQNKIRWFLDDQFFHEVNISVVSPDDYPFNQPFFFIFNVAVGGNWPGNPDSSTQFPQRMQVDYVRVFQ